MFTLTKKKGNTLADNQVTVWIAWENRINPNGFYQSEYDAWGRRFIKFSGKSDVCDIYPHEVESFLEHVAGTYNTTHTINTARKAVNALRRFYTARGRQLAKSIRL